MKEQKNRKLKIIIVVLAVLLAVSLTALIGTLVLRYFYNHEAVSVEVPGNIITPDREDDSSSVETDSALSSSPDDETSNQLNTSVSPDQSTPTSVSETEPLSVSTDAAGATSASGEKAKAIALHNRKPENNTPFQVTNMFPGDRETKYYCVKVSYKGDIVVRYHADIRDGYEKLAEVLKVRIRLPDTDELLYDGLMRDMPKSLNHPLYTNERTQSELYYEITAYLETSVGNDYQDRELIADFRWWVEETDNLDIPQTGDTSNLYLWICLAAGSLFLLLILLAKRRKEASDEVKQQ